jgi:hypothetical protein
MKHLLSKHFLLVATLGCSALLLIGMLFVDERQFPYDDGGLGTVYFFTESVIHLFMAPGFGIARALGLEIGTVGEVAVATAAMTPIAIAADWLLRRLRR